MPTAFRVFSTYLLSFFLLSATAQAATLSFVGYDLQPHRQRVLISTDVSLGYPVGDAAVGVALDCKSGKVSFVNLGYSMLGSVAPFTDFGAAPAGTALRQALLASGLVSSKPGVLSVKVVRPSGTSTVTSRCRQGVLDAALVDQARQESIRTIKVPIYSEEAEPNSFNNTLGYDASTLTIEGDVVAGPRQFTFQDLTVGGTLSGEAALTSLQVLLSDSKSLYPIYYGGGAQTNAALDKLAVPAVLTVYVSYDGTS